VVVRGRVQGVFFRDSCRREAERAGLRGWVRNGEDGSVEAVFVGADEAVERLLAWCHAGPPSARVDGVEVSEAPEEDFAGFEIR
jgi:acylphosphatase